MDRLNVFWDALFGDHFWRDFFMVMSGILSEKVRRWWKMRDTNPYRWDCVDCREAEGMFRCSANSIDAIDAMILDHKERAHSA